GRRRLKVGWVVAEHGVGGRWLAAGNLWPEKLAEPLAHADLAQRGEVDRPRAVERALARRQWIFETSCAIEKHGLFTAINASVGETLLECGISGGAFGA